MLIFGYPGAKFFHKAFLYKKQQRFLQNSEAATGGILYKRYSLKKFCNTCCQSLFSLKWQALGLQFYLKRDSGTDVFLWFLRKIQEHLFTEQLWKTASKIIMWKCSNSFHFWFISRVFRKIAVVIIYLCQNL